MTVPALPSSPYIVRSGRLRAHIDATSIRADAEAAAARVRAGIAAERHEALESARQEGLRLGLAEAAALTAGAALAVDLFWRERENELAEVALAVAHRVLASLPADDTMARLVSDAIAEHGRDVRLAVRVMPGAAGALRTALEDLEHGGRVTVVADPAAAPGECTLVHPRGRTDVGLLAQFRAMMGSLAGDRAAVGEPDR